MNTLEDEWSSRYDLPICSYVVGYSWSKFMEANRFLNASDPLPYEVVARADRTHNFKLTGIYPRFLIVESRKGDFSRFFDSDLSRSLS